MANMISENSIILLVVWLCDYLLGVVSNKRVVSLISGNTKCAWWGEVGGGSGLVFYAAVNFLFVLLKDAKK